MDFVDAAALFAVGVAAAIDDDAVAGSDGRERFDFDVAAADGADGAEERAALFAVAGVDELLVVDAVHPAGVEASGEGHFEFVFVG